MSVSLHPAGHILGSAQVRVEHRGEVWVASGDYKTDPDPTCTPFELLRCHTFITESTFGLPIYRWTPDAEVFDATHEVIQQEDGFKLTIVLVGPTEELNVFELAGNTESERQVPMFGRGRLDHLALQAASIEAFEEIRARLLARGATDGFVTDFGHLLSVFFVDPDGLESEVCVPNPDAVPGVYNPPGTPSRRFHPEGTEPPS